MKDLRTQYLQDLERAREEGDEHAVVCALFSLVEITPLFTDHLSSVRDWLREARRIAIRTVIWPRQEVLQLLRGAETFLAVGSAREAFDVATEACRVAQSAQQPGLEDRAWMVSARALVRLGQQDDAVELFSRVIDRELAPEDEEPIAPGLAFLAVGEAHLFDGRYEGAYEPLERAVGLLPNQQEADRLRYDALVGLGMLDSRQGAMESAALRYRAAMQLADKHASVPEQVTSLLLMGSLCRGQNDPVNAFQYLSRAIALSGEAMPPQRALTFPTERLRNLVGRGSAEELMDGARDLAGDCGRDGDLMGYVQLTTVVAALMDHAGQGAEALDMLQTVMNRLDEGEQPEAVSVLRRYHLGYSTS